MHAIVNMIKNMSQCRITYVMFWKRKKKIYSYHCLIVVMNLFQSFFCFVVCKVDRRRESLDFAA